ncbi:alpha/beta fold hydrolase [Chromobacterium sphagni]|uniref:Arylesterase n=1 Tax=Chromobacterium sphagni TaxID=1903179 RepID=A0ABX3CFJ5_9NEIS|nr:alpha/beta hydrolase [Chromobacterium sphagni]OHX20777.1 arylesterase [Chromobacterium sphagni]
MNHITTTDGVRLHVKTWGEGRPVIMAHGWPLSADSFDDLAMAIADAGMRAIFYDRRGFGRSDQPWSGYDYDTLADDLAAVVEQMSAQDAALLGFSMGGGEVARYLARHGDRRITQAVLISSILPFLLKTDDNPHGVEQYVFDQMSADIEADRTQFWSGFFKDFFGIGLVSHLVSKELIDWCRSMAMQAGLRPALACIQAFSSTDFRRDLADFTMPTLIIHGNADKIVPFDKSSRRTANEIAQATLIEYDNAPHGVLFSHKDRLIKDVVGFLREGPKRTCQAEA